MTDKEAMEQSMKSDGAVWVNNKTGKEVVIPLDTTVKLGRLFKAMGTKEFYETGTVPVAKEGD